MQDRREAGKEGCRKGEMHERLNAGKERCRKGWIQKISGSRKEIFRKGVIVQDLQFLCTAVHEIISFLASFSLLLLFIYFLVSPSQDGVLIKKAKEERMHEAKNLITA